MVAQQKPEPWRQHILLVCFPSQSHVNPALRLASRLTLLGVRVTLSTAVYAHRRMFPEANKDSSFPLQDPNDSLLCYHPYSDGFDDRALTTPVVPPQEYMERVHKVGSETLRAIVTSSGQHPPFTCLINTLFLPWVALLARDLCLPSATFWIQPASLFLVYHHYFHDHRAAIDTVHNSVDDKTGTAASEGQPSVGVDLPGLPRLEAGDLPSFLAGTGPLGGAGLSGGDGDSHNSDGTSLLDAWTNVFLREIALSLRILDESFSATGRKPKVLINTLDELEQDALSVLGGILDFLPVGMVVPPACTDPKVAAAPPSSDFIKHHDKSEYICWLDRWPASSVVYISFGSYSELRKAQADELVKALGAIRRPFLWVVKKDVPSRPDESAIGENGKLVAWCDQVEVLRHSSVGCFVSHCGWNSTAEAIAAGVPMVAMPLWTDQPMNAKLIEGVWRNGVRPAARWDGVVQADELERCVNLVMGDCEEGAAIRRKAAEWGDKARAAVREGGSSDRNLRAFVDDIGLVP